MEEDEYEEFMEVAQMLRERDDLHFGVVTNRKVVEAFKKAKIIDRSPSMVLYTPSAASLDASKNRNKVKGANIADGAADVKPDSSSMYLSTNLDELFADGSNRGGVHGWIVYNTCPGGKLINSNLHHIRKLENQCECSFLI